MIYTSVYCELYSFHPRLMQCLKRICLSDDLFNKMRWKYYGYLWGYFSFLWNEAGPLWAVYLMWRWERPWVRWALTCRDGSGLFVKSKNRKYVSDKMLLSSQNEVRSCFFFSPKQPTRLYSSTQQHVHEWKTQLPGRKGDKVNISTHVSKTSQMWTCGVCALYRGASLRCITLHSLMKKNQLG